MPSKAEMIEQTFIATTMDITDLRTKMFVRELLRYSFGTATQQFPLGGHFMTGGTLADPYRKVLAKVITYLRNHEDVPDEVIRRISRLEAFTA